MEYTRETAKELLKKGEYTSAEEIYRILWNKCDGKNIDLLIEFGTTLRKNEKSREFIEIVEKQEVGINYINNYRIKSCYAWCLYDYYIKNYEYTDDENDKFNVFIDKAKYIVENTEQKEAEKYYLTPYVLTVLKVVKIYLKMAAPNYKKIISWLTILNPDILSEEVFNIKDSEGNERELASHKEFYYQNIIKALEKLERYSECIEKCELALKEIKKFHYKNHIWIKARMLFSKCMISESIEDDIEEYKKMADQNKFWFMYYKLSQICFRYNKVEDCLLYACKAIMFCNSEYKTLVKVFLDVALILNSINKEEAIIFFQASGYYREKNAWKLSEELKYFIELYNINIFKSPQIKRLKEIAHFYIDKYEKKDTGYIKFFFPHGNSGFIVNDADNEDIFFNKKDILYSAKLQKGDRVSYIIKSSSKGRAAAEIRRYL